MIPHFATRACSPMGRRGIGRWVPIFLHYSYNNNLFNKLFRLDSCKGANSASSCRDNGGALLSTFTCMPSWDAKKCSHIVFKAQRAPHRHRVACYRRPIKRVTSPPARCGGARRCLYGVHPPPRFLLRGLCWQKGYAPSR